MLDLPLDGGERNMAEKVAVYVSETAVDGVDTTDTGGELICFGYM